MKTTLDLLNKVTEMGFDREKALEDIDKSLDEEFGYENRKPIDEEVLSDELYENIVFGFECEKEWKKTDSNIETIFSDFVRNLTSNDIDLDNKLDNMCDVELTYDQYHSIKENNQLKNEIEEYIKSHVKDYFEFIYNESMTLWFNMPTTKLDLSAGLYNCDELYMKAIKHVLEQRKEERK